MHIAYIINDDPVTDYFYLSKLYNQNWQTFDIAIMSMERQFFIKDSHSKHITTIGYHPTRRVYIIGFEGTCLFV